MNIGEKEVLTVVLISILVIFLPFGVASQEADEEGATKYVIGEIKLSGNEKVSDQEILAELGLETGDSVTKTELKKRIQAVRDMGYFKAVESDSEVADGEINIGLEFQEYPVLEEVKFEGVSLLGQNKLKKLLKDAGVKKGEVINKTELNEGLNKITNKYEEKGYPFVTTGNVQISSSLVIEVIEGELASLRVEGLETVPEEVALGMINVPKGKPVKLDALRESYQDLRNSIYFTSVDLVPARGYAKMDIILRWELSERRVIDQSIQAESISLEGNTVFPDRELERLVGKLPEGEVSNYDLLDALQPVYDRYADRGYSFVDFSLDGVKDGVAVVKVSEGRVSVLTIKGNTNTKRKVITNKLLISEGDLYNKNLLVDSRRRLLNLDYFSEVTPTPERTSEGVRVVITVSEKGKLNSINGGLTWSDSGLGGKIQLSTKNLFGLGQDLSLNLKRKFSLDAKFGGDLTWKNSYYPSGFNFTKLSLYRNIGSSRGVKASFGYPLSGNLSLNMGYNADWILGDDDSGNQLTHILSADLIYDDRNNPLFPTAGTRRSLKVEKAGDFAPGLSFTQFTFTGSYFQELPNLDIAGEKKQTLGFNLQLGLGMDTPENYQQEFGGKNSIRGLSKGQARNYGFLNGEYRLQLIPGSLYLTSFFDSGLDLGSGEAYDFRATAGLEVNLLLFGRLRIGAGWPISEELDYVPNFYFAMGQMF